MLGLVAAWTAQVARRRSGPSRRCRTIATPRSQSAASSGGAALADRWSVKAEYLFYDLGRLTVAFADAQFPQCAFSASADYAGHIARVGVNFRLD